MPAVVDILDLGGTTPKDFTLHDSNHSFRVAERMWELIPETTRGACLILSWGCFCFSAYLHDIGMSPKFEEEKSADIIAF